VRSQSAAERIDVRAEIEDLGGSARCEGQLSQIAAVSHGMVTRSIQRQRPGQRQARPRRFSHVAPSVSPVAPPIFRLRSGENQGGSHGAAARGQPAQSENAPARRRQHDDSPQRGWPTPVTIENGSQPGRTSIGNMAISTTIAERPANGVSSTTAQAAARSSDARAANFARSTTTMATIPWRRRGCRA